MKRGPAFEIANAWKRENAQYNKFSIGDRVFHLDTNKQGKVIIPKEEDMDELPYWVRVSWDDGTEGLEHESLLFKATKENNKAIALGQVPEAIDLAGKALLAGDEESYVTKRIMQVFGASEKDAKEIVWQAMQRTGLSMKASKETSDEKTQKELSEGLQGIVRDYRQALKFGNDKLASIIKGRIDDIIRKEGLDELEVYESAVKVGDKVSHKRTGKTGKVLEVNYNTQLNPIKVSWDDGEEKLYTEEELEIANKEKQNSTVVRYFAEIRDDGKWVVLDSKTGKAITNADGNPVLFNDEVEADQFSNELHKQMENETAEAKLKVVSDLDTLWQQLQGAIPEGVTKEELVKYYDEISKTFTLPEEWKDVLSASGIEFTTEGNMEEETEMASLSISVESHPLEEIHAWEAKLEDLDIVFPVSLDMQSKTIKWKVKDEDREYVSEFLDNLDAKYENASREKANHKKVGEKIKTDGKIATVTDVYLRETKEHGPTPQWYYKVKDSSGKEWEVWDGDTENATLSNHNLFSSSKEKATNPNVNQVLGTNEELFNHAFVAQDGKVLTVSIESYDRTLKPGEGSKISDMVYDRRSELLKKYPGTEWVEIYSYSE